MPSLPISLRLAVRQWRARPLRPLLCSLAIAAAVALIICVGVMMDSLRYTLSAAIGRALGVAEVHVRPAQYGTDARVPEDMLQKVRALPEVQFADGRLHSFAALNKGTDHLVYDVLGIDLAMDELLRPKQLRDGRLLSSDPKQAAHELLIDDIISANLNLKVGDTVQYVENESMPHTMTVVGILHRPNLEILTKPTIYVSYEFLLGDMQIPRSYNVLDIKLKESAHLEDFDAYARELGKKLGDTVDVEPGTTSKAKLGDLTRTMRLLLLLLSTMSGFCAALIIGTTLSVGVQERIRQFGQLRCIGASRGQLALFLLGDALVMLIIGASLGILLGIGLAIVLVMCFPSFFKAYEVSWISVATAIFCGTFATFLGAMIPIWQVTRVSPMTAVTAVAKPPRRSRVWLTLGLGLAMLALQLLLWFALPTREIRFYTYVVLGVPLIFAGWCLIAPGSLVFFEHGAAETLGRLWAVRPALLRSAWSRTPWRAAAMIAALMIGVTLFITVRARGLSLMASWTTPARIPDIIAKKPIGGIKPVDIENLRKRIPALGKITTFDYFGVRLTDKVFQLGKLFSEGETTFIAVDPQTFSNMLELEYLQGDPATAVRELADGRHVFVSKEYFNVRKLGVGDKVRFKAASGETVEFTISAVVTSTGVELVQNFFDLRNSFAERSTSSVLGSIADGKKYFKLGDPTMLLADIDPSAVASPGEMNKVLDEMRKDYLPFSSIELKTSLNSLISKLMNGLSIIGFGALCVASLGVANMVIASVHARRFEFGVLRAIGAGRGQLVRLVLAEVSLIGLVAGILGAGAGLQFAYMGSQIDLVVVGFPTHFLAVDVAHGLLNATELVLTAIFLTTLLAWLASVGPAIKGARAAQRTLLASGRA